MMAIDIHVEETVPVRETDWTAEEVRTLAGVLGFVFGLAFLGPAGAAAVAAVSWVIAKLANPG